MWLLGVGGVCSVSVARFQADSCVTAANVQLAVQNKKILVKIIRIQFLNEFVANVKEYRFIDCKHKRKTCWSLIVVS